MRSLPSATEPAPLRPEPSLRRSPPRDWRQRLGDAWRGIKRGIRGRSSFFEHFFFAALALAAGLVLHCRVLEWCLLLGCMGMVLTAELFHSALETLLSALEPASLSRARSCLDIAAGAVLLTTVAAGGISSLVFLSRLMELFGWR